MKKIIALIAAIAMLFSLGVVLTACGGNNGEEEYTTTEEYTTKEYTTEFDETTTDVNGDETTNNEVTTTTSATTTQVEITQAADPYLPPENLSQLSQAEQLEYFNRVVNRVRRERPGHNQVQTLRIEELNFTGAVGAAPIQAIINNVVNNLMPGNPETRVRTRGQDVQSYWMSDSPNFAANLRPQDITRITSTRQGNNWRIEVRVREENNPQHFVSHHGRIATIQTREDIVASIVDDAPVTGDPNNATVRYHNGFAWVVVNPQGQIIEAANGFDVNARIDGARIGVGILSVGTNVTAVQTSRWAYNSFRW